PITSPILVGDLLIMRGRMVNNTKTHCWMAVDKRNGEIVWQTPKHGGRSYTDASPTHHQLPIGGDESQLLDVLWCPTGQVLRVEDGVELASELGCQGNGRPWAVQGDVLAIENGSSDGGRGQAQTWDEGLLAFRLQAPNRDTVTAKLLWHRGNKDQPGRLTAFNGVLYGVTQSTAYALDLMTGKELSKAGFPRGAEKVHHLTAIAGGLLFGLSHVNDCTVFALGANGRQLSCEGVSRLGERLYHKYDFFNEGAQPFFSGNRIFIRSYSDIWCIGDPSEPLRLSAVHDGQISVRVAAQDDDTQEDEEKDDRGGLPDADAPATPSLDKDGVRKALSAAIAAGKRPRFTMASTGMEVEITGFTDGSLALASKGMRMQFPFDRLDDADLRKLAAALE
ncbi:MAG: hypothetical protein ACOCZK_03755, partial [Planctomycetota bacterium]